MEWFFVGRFESMGFGYNEYTNKDNTKCRQVWEMMATKKFLKFLEKPIDKFKRVCYNNGTKRKGDNLNVLC